MSDINFGIKYPIKATVELTQDFGDDVQLRFEGSDGSRFTVLMAFDQFYEMAYPKDAFRSNDPIATASVLYVMGKIDVGELERRVSVALKEDA